MKYKTEVYTAIKAYSSHKNLSYAQIKCIEDSNYDNIPSILETELGNIEVYNTYDEFVPPILCYEKPNQIWSHSKKSDWYTHILTGVKIKLVQKRTPDYSKENGCGSCTTTLLVKVPQPSNRGKNPDSHRNKPKLISAIRNIGLTDEQWEKIESLGEGKGYSHGVRKLLDLFTYQTVD
jgi:hypothetical protein